MIRVLPETHGEVTPSRTAPATANDLFAARLCTAPARSAQAALKIGIRWRCPTCDRDLWSRESSSQYIFFQNPRTNEGWLNQDYLVSPGDNAYEMISYNGPVDLRRTEALVNFYAGRETNGPDFDVRVWVEDCAYDAHLHMPASEGNRAAGRFDDPAWVRLDLAAITGLQWSVQR